MSTKLILKGIIIAVVAAFFSLPSTADDNDKPHKECIYRLTLNDKNGSRHRPEKPQTFLSKKSIERRKRQNIPVDSTDMPVSETYLKKLRKSGLKVIGTSRWHNSVLVLMSDSGMENRLKAIEGVKDCRMVWQMPDSLPPEENPKELHVTFNKWDSLEASHYGATEEQTKILNGHALHNAGYRGEGMTIAVLDGGFLNADLIPTLRSIRLAGEHDFVYHRKITKSDDNSYSGSTRSPIYRNADHGTRVLSIMAADVPHVFVGTAPEASYWLLRCEDVQTEMPIEEDYWTMAAEFADSAGVDIINSSLGYYEFDRHWGDHKYKEMDGRTTFISQSASMLADKGIVLVCSAGNMGMMQWKKIGFPADADNIIAVGALTPKLQNAAFSSVGPTQDGRVKPDVMAIGAPASVISGRGTVVQSMGTSFASPIVCGLVACLWQARQELTARDIIELVRKSGNNYNNPDNIFGYGIPDFSMYLF
ncbi:MAG: S8 family peptidase [Prevotella sp.]